MNISSSTASSALPRLDPQQMREAMFKKADDDGRGGISKDELATMLANGPQGSDSANAPDVDELFSKIDADGDGEISKTENDAALDEMQKNGPPPPPPGDAGFSGATDKLTSLLEALEDDDDDDDASTSVDATTMPESAATAAAQTAQEELAKLVEKLTAQLKQDGEATSLFKTTA